MKKNIFTALIIAIDLLCLVIVASIKAVYSYFTGPYATAVWVTAFVVNIVIWAGAILLYFFRKFEEAVK